MKNTWIDITDLVGWEGTYTGIQRVIYELAKGYSESGVSARFFEYRNHSRSFHEVDFKSIGSSSVDSTISQGSHTAKYINAKKLALLLAPPISIRTTKSIRRRTYAAMNLLKNEKAIGDTSRVFEGKHPFEDSDRVVVLGLHTGGFPVSLTNLVNRLNLEYVQVIYDTIPMNGGLSDPGMTIATYDFYRSSLRYASLIMAISNNTKNDLVKLSKEFNLTCPEIKVFRLGDKIEINGTVNSEKSNNKTRNNDFILCVGTFEIRKNHTLLYYAYRLAAQKGVDLPKLIIAGRKGWLSETPYFLIKNDPEIQDKISIIDPPSDTELELLYKNCLFTVMPSYYEGWGLPIAESLNYGKLCLVSNTSSMPEVGGKLCEYFSPYDPDELMKLIDKYYSSKKLLAQKNTEIINNFAPTTWHESFKKFDSIINQSFRSKR
jgi:glycosyltransferase involved in cell wall biosynthesis